MSDEKNKSGKGGSAAGGKAEAPQEEPKAPKEVKTGSSQAKKVGKMNSSELDQAIEACQKHMGGLWSNYGLSLVAHRKAMVVSAPVQRKKAA